MIDLIADLWPTILLALVIGLATGWWIWGGADDERLFEAEGKEPVAFVPPPLELEPEAAVEPAPIPFPGPEPVAIEPAQEAEPLIAASLTDSEPEPAAGAEPAPEPQADPEPEAEPEPTPPSEPAAPSPFLSAPEGEPDNLTRIKGVGPKLADLLNSLGVFHFRQIAGWSDAQVTEVDSHLDTFKGRITRDRWVDQAKLLDARNVAAFEREFGKLNGPI
jgi:predicted flap endonuclease-1-like 5' DNA nuclease